MKIEAKAVKTFEFKLTLSQAEVNLLAAIINDYLDFLTTPNTPADRKSFAKELLGHMAKAHNATSDE